MASLKAKYQGRVKFYFVRYDDPKAASMVKEFEITKHPTTIIFDKESDPVFRLNGFDKNKPKDIEDAITKVLD